jgi:hypothetical protein
MECQSDSSILAKNLGKLTFAVDGQLVAAESGNSIVLEEKANED